MRSPEQVTLLFVDAGYIADHEKIHLALAQEYSPSRHQIAVLDNSGVRPNRTNLLRKKLRVGMRGSKSHHWCRRFRTGLPQNVRGLGSGNSGSSQCFVELRRFTDHP